MGQVFGMSETPSEIAVLRAALAASEARASAAEDALVAAKGELTQVQAIVSASESDHAVVVCLHLCLESPQLCPGSL